MVSVLQPVNITMAINSAAEIIQPLINAKQILVINQYLPCHTVLADPTRLKQVLVNLLSNAANYNHHGGYIKISSRLAGNDWLRLCITDTDTGPGISQEKHQYLFNLKTAITRLYLESK